LVDSFERDKKFPLNTTGKLLT